MPWQLLIELMGPLGAFLYFLCSEFRSPFPQSWCIYFAYIGIDFLIAMYAFYLETRKSFKKLIKEMPKIVLFSLLIVFIQIPIVVARLLGMLSFPWRRLIWRFFVLD